MEMIFDVNLLGQWKTSSSKQKNRYVLPSLGERKRIVFSITAQVQNEGS